MTKLLTVSHTHPNADFTHIQDTPHTHTILPDIDRTLENNITLSHQHNINTTMHTNTIYIRRGIFQGDELSLLWFCLALNPQSNRLSNTQYGYKIINQHQ